MPSSYTPAAAVRVGSPIRYNRPETNVIGDTWACAWTPSGELFTVIDDTSGFEFVLRPTRNRNLMLASFGDSAPPLLHGRNVNSMDAFGHSNRLGKDGACWKANGIISVDDVLHMSVSRHWYHRKDYDHRQISRDGTIISSSDGGRTWSSLPQLGEALPNPLFTGANFATCFFVDYGQDGHLPADLPHEANEWVYAVSTNGYWNNGNALHLGRVRRKNIGANWIADWEFFAGCRGESNEPVWAKGESGLNACYPILSRPYSFGQTGMNYVPALGAYLLVGWHYPELSTANWQHSTCVWDFYQSPTPWGPWTKFGAHTWDPQGFYNPILPSKFISADGRRLWALTCGNFNDWNTPATDTLYSLHLVPLELE